MTGFFTKERFGTPQLVAAALLFLFVGQCVWLVRHETVPVELNQRELFRIEQGLKQWNGKGIAGIVPALRSDDSSGIPPEIEANAGYDPNHSPLWYLISAAPIFAWQRILNPHDARNWTWLERVPFIFLRHASRSIPVVCSPPALWQCRRIHRPHPLLFLAGDHQIEFVVVRGTGNRRRLGNVWRGVYRDCRRAYTLRPARGGSLELAPNRSIGTVNGVGGGIPIFSNYFDCRSRSHSCCTLLLPAAPPPA